VAETAAEVRPVPLEGLTARRRVAIVPALNEEACIGRVVEEIRAFDSGVEIVIVDDGSGDRTADVARAHGARVIRLPFNLGIGGAVQTGFRYAWENGFDLAVRVDGDGQHDPADVEPLIEAVRQGADVALGSRFLSPGAYHGGLFRRAGRRLFSLLLRALTGLRLTDPTSGLKALGPRGQTLFALARFPDRFPDADALVLARRARLALAERPARMRQSHNRHSMHGGGRAVAYTFNMFLSLLVAAAGRESDLRG